MDSYTEFLENFTNGVVADSGLQIDMVWIKGVVSHLVKKARYNFLPPDRNNPHSYFNMSIIVLIAPNFAILQPFE
jgi:hypothetical protein